MSPPLKIARLTPNGEIRTADLLTSIAKRLRWFSAKEDGPGPRRGELLRDYADQLADLAATMEETP